MPSSCPGCPHPASCHHYAGCHHCPCIYGYNGAVLELELEAAPARTNQGV